MTTYIQQVQTNYLQALRDLRDELETIEGWEVWEDDLGDAEEYPDEPEGGWSAQLSYNTPYRDDFRLSFREHQDRAVELRLGEAILDDDDEPAFNHESDRLRGGPLNSTSSSNPDIEADDTVEYWLSYSETHFLMFLRRVEADGYDGSVWFGAEVPEKLWPYQNADGRESDWVSFLEGTEATDSGTESWEGCYLHGCEGAINPDGNFANYIWTEGLVRSFTYQVGDTGHEVIVGPIEAFVYDESGSGADSRDVVQDEDANDMFEILKYNEVQPVAIRMN